MGHRSRKYRASRATDENGMPLIRALPQQPRSQPLTKRELQAYTPPPTRLRGPMRRMLAQTKGARKWVNGLPTVHYVREGYFWFMGRYIPGTKATGITHKYSHSRAALRAEFAAAEHPPKGTRKYLNETKAMSDRAHAKRKRRAAFDEQRIKERGYGHYGSASR